MDIKTSRSSSSDSTIQASSFRTLTMSDFNFYTEGQSVIERWGQSIQGKTGPYKQPFGNITSASPILTDYSGNNRHQRKRTWSSNRHCSIQVSAISPTPPRPQLTQSPIRTRLGQRNLPSNPSHIYPHWAQWLRLRAQSRNPDPRPRGQDRYTYQQRGRYGNPMGQE